MNLTSTIDTATGPSASTRPLSARTHLARQILAAATLAAVLDAAFAFVAYVVIDGRYNLETLLQYIASGAFGDRAFASGVAGVGYATAGFAIHFAIALTYAGVYAATPARRLFNTLQARVLGGIGYGAAIWIFMNAAVLPLTQAGQERFLSGWYNAFLVDHALFVGLPIALVITGAVAGSPSAHTPSEGRR